jgi:hypothetical protein
VTVLQGLTQEEIIQKLQHTAKQLRSESRPKAVERPSSPGPVAVKRGVVGVGPANFASSQTPDNKRRGTLRARTKRTYAEVDSDADNDDDYEDEGDVEEVEEVEEEEEEEEVEEEEAMQPQPQEEILVPPQEYIVVMSGNPLECGICFQEFDDADAMGAAELYMFWVCQHARQCGDCAMRV